MPTPIHERKLMGEINVVPYIDVMLVLLIIFMVTAPLLTQGIKVELPKAGAEPIENVSDAEPLVLSVDAEGNLFLNIGDDEESPLAGQEIVRRIAQCHTAMWWVQWCCCSKVALRVSASLPTRSILTRSPSKPS